MLTRSMSHARASKQKTNCNAAFLRFRARDKTMRSVQCWLRVRRTPHCPYVRVTGGSPASYWRTDWRPIAPGIENDKLMIQRDVIKLRTSAQLSVGTQSLWTTNAVRKITAKAALLHVKRWCCKSVIRRGVANQPMPLDILRMGASAKSH